ncbi:hypothetical protein TCAL_15320 [Tigriopus californicus]|uniref:BAH domain-containing protein n=1 Tax=Tigriopus californicus TaxID=6832 RepID=A0A553PMA1_TIGCA|nr:hypothetical protein TCAL_15320 [Tigriopus californicus]
MAAPPYPPTYPYPYPTEYLPPGYAAPPPSHIPYHQGTAQLPGGPPPPPPQAPLHYAPYHPAEFRHPSYPMYHHANPAATAPGYPPQGPYYLAPALPYHPSALSSTTSPSSSTSGTQVALSAPHPAGTAFYYGGYSAAAYPYTAAGRIVTPILALAPPGHQPPPPHSMVPPGFPTQHHQAQTSIYSYSVQHDPKNVQAGSQPVGKGLNSQPPPPPTFATTPTTATSIVVSTGVSTKSVCSANSKKAPKSVNSSSKDLRPTLKVPTPKSHGALPSQVVPNEVYRTILPRQPLPPKGPPGYSKSKSSRARSPPEVAVVAASKAKVSNVKACNPPNPVQPFVVGQTTIHPVDPNAIRKPHKPVVVESQMATITPKMMPIVSTAASRTSSSTGKSSLRDYRKPAKSKHQLSSPATMATITHSQSSPNSSSGLKCIPSVIVPNPPSENRAINPPSTAIYQHLPKGLTITEIDRSRSLSSKSSVKGSKITTVPSNSETLTATTSQNPSATSASSVFSTSSSSTASLMTAPHSNGHRFHLMPVINIPDPHKNRRPPPPTSTGHPGLPNGLLRMAHTSLQQQSQPPPPKIATKVVPKDLKSQLALSKIALSMASGTTSQDGGSQGGYQASNSCSTSTSSTSVSKNGQPPPPPSISVSMAKSAAMALHPHQHPIPKLLPKKSKSTLLKTRKVNNNKPTLLLNGGRSTSSLKSTSRLCGVGTASPGSSRSSSRNSSLSPRERSGSSSKGGSATVPFLGVGGGKSVMSSGSSSGSNNSSGGGSGKVPLSPLSRGSSSINKKKVAINQFQGPLIPWSKRHNGDMMMSLLWYYRPEHLESGRRSDDMSDEVYASRHRDNTSVACIEDKCYVMTFNEYCRYRKFLRMVDQGLSCGTSIVPDPLPGYERAEFLPTQRVAPDRVFLCRRVYESRQRRLLKNPY